MNLVFAMILGGSLAALLPAGATDVTSTWKTAADGTWDTNSRWTNMPVGGGYPNNGNAGVATYDAVIGVTGTGYIVTLSPSSSITVEDLTISSPNAFFQHYGTLTATAAISLSAGSWNINGTSGTLSNSTVNVIGGTMSLGSSNGGGTISGGTLNFGSGQALVVNNGDNLLTGVTVNGELNLNVTGARTKIEAGTTFNQARLKGQLNSLGFASGQTLAVPILFEGSAGGNRYVEMNSTAGTFTIGPTGVIRTEAGFAGNGTIGGNQNYGGLMTLSNQGLISSQVSARTITISSATMANTGTLSASNGGILTISPTGTWTNGGTIAVSTASIVNLGSTFNATSGIGTWNNTGGSVNITGTINNVSNALTLNSSTGSWTLNGGSISGGTLAFANGQSLIFANKSANSLNGVTVMSDLTLDVTSGRTNIEGGTAFPIAHLAANSTQLSFSPTSTLNGTILIDSTPTGTRSVLLTATGTFTIGSTGIIRIETGSGGDLILGDGNFGGGIEMTLDNQGLLSSRANGRTMTIEARTFTNKGTVEATNGGILSRAGGYTQSAGSTKLDGGTIIAKVGVNNSLITINGGALEGNGSILANVLAKGLIDPATGVGGLAVSGDLSLGTNTEFRFALGGMTKGTQYDFLSEAGSAALTLDGVLTLSFANGFQNSVTSANTFTILSSNQILAGAFDNVANGARLTTTDGFGSFVVNYGTNSAFNTPDVVLSNFQVPEPTGGVLLIFGFGALCNVRVRARISTSIARFLL